MTDKQIIIDGVDVSECKYIEFEPYAEPYCNNNDGEDLDCCSYPYCYYKQLKRKEQECDQLKAENEELKKASITLAEGLNIR